MKCFYHISDLDGKASAAIVKYKYPECELIGINYGDEFDYWDSIKLCEKVFMVDFSLPKDLMFRLNSVCNLHWIDHHITAIESMSDMKINGLRRDGIGACQLVYEYLYDNHIPTGIELLAKYDVWDHRDPYVLPFQYGMMSISHDPEKDFDIWKHIIEDDIEFIHCIIEKGRTIISYENIRNKGLVKSLMFETEFEGLKFICANIAGTNSKFFDSVWDDDKYDGMIIFSYRNNKWVFSLYTPPYKTDKIDLSIIAKKYGGGGHKGACGFVCDKLPSPFYELLNKKGGNYVK